MTGTTPSKGDAFNYGNDFPFYKPTDLDNGINTNIAGDNLSAEGFEKARQLPINSVLVTCIGATIGKTGLIRRSGSCNQQINAIIPHSFVEPEYLYYCCVSGYGQDAIISNASATTLPILNKSKFSELLFPLPPIAEQKRILGAIHNCLEIIEGIDEKRIELHKLIQAAKTKMLDLAIHGKLVPQSPADEPAIELLRRINPAFQPAHNLHYTDCPTGWAIATVSDIFEINPRIQASDDADAGFVAMASICDGFDNDFSYEVRKWGNIKKGFTRFEDGDIAVAKISPCLENRKSVILRNLPNGIGAGTTELNIFRSSIVVPEYGLLFFKSDYFINSCAGSYNGVVGQQRVSRSLIEEMQFLLPPIDEQRRIISAVNDYFAVLNRIEAAL